MRKISRSITAGASIIGVALSYAAWAQQPAQAMLTSREAQRHDDFIVQANGGDIDLVFFGTTETEMWSWPDRGGGVWEQTFSSLSAANFGSQGTQASSLLWRMQNGELDGYEAKLIVLQAGMAGGLSTDPDAYSALLNEIHARQPQAAILLFAPLPRGHSLEEYRQTAQTNAAAFSRFVDGGTVFYVDIGEQFFNADASFKRETWSDGGIRGTQRAAFEIWAVALQPWLDRFVR
jgi:hypothetical protein